MPPVSDQTADRTYPEIERASFVLLLESLHSNRQHRSLFCLDPNPHMKIKFGGRRDGELTSLI